MKRLFPAIIFNLVFLFCRAEDYKYPYSATQDRDPFLPLVNERGQILIAEEKEMSDILLEGIIYSPQDSTAIINSEPFKEGDIFGDYKIIKIEPSKVLLRKDGEEFILKWEEK